MTFDIIVVFNKLRIIEKKNEKRFLKRVTI